MQIRLIQGWLPWFMGLPQIVSFIFIYLVVVRPTEPQTGLPLLTDTAHAAQRTRETRRATLTCTNTIVLPTPPRRGVRPASVAEARVRHRLPEWPSANEVLHAIECLTVH